MASKAEEFARQVADALIEQLKAGTAPWQKPWAPGRPMAFMPHNPVTGKPYKGGNAMWLMMVGEARGFADTRWMTYRQAEGIGAQVRGGEKGSPIEYWQWQDEVPVKDAAGRPVRDADGKVVTQTVDLEHPRRFGATVFNAAQIDGLAPLVEPPAPTWDRHERAEALLTASGASIRHVEGDRAFYSPIDDRITLPQRGQFDSADGYYQVALHELGHWTGHASRLNRGLFSSFGSPEYAREELRAEIAALMVGGELGIGHDPSRCAAYVESWIKALQDDPREIIRAAGDAQKAQGFVLAFERTRERQLEREERAPVVAVLREAGAPLVQEETAMRDQQRRYVVCPFGEKEELKRVAKAVGVRAEYDKAAKSWHIPAAADPAPFQRWIDRPTVVRPDPATEFAAALQAAGLRLGEAPNMDGVLHRVPVEGDGAGERSGAYKGHLDGHPAGFIENFKTGYREAWKVSGPVAKVEPAELERLQREAATRLADRAAARDVEAAKAAKVARHVWDSAKELPGAAPHPYLVEKGIPAMGAVRVDEKGALLVPVLDAAGGLQSLQWIGPDGTKRFKKGGRVAGGRFVLNPEAVDRSVAEGRAPVIIVAEGYATAATLARATGATVAVAFNAGNLEAVARSVREAHPGAVLVVAGDNDEAAARKNRPNVGKEKALAAAAAAGGTALLPAFEGVAGSDWNDLERARGTAHVQGDLLARIMRAATEQGRASPSVAAPTRKGAERQLERDGLVL